MATNGKAPQEITVPVLTDLDVESEAVQDILKYAGHLIRAAKEDRLAAVICQHNDSNKMSTILCYTYPMGEDGKLGYIPIGQLFDDSSESWTNLTPPTSGIQTANGTQS